VILFGSFSRGDWNKSSDIDIFIYGTIDNFDKAHFESVLKHDIQLFHYTNIIYDNWKNVEFQMDLYIKTIDKEIKKKLKEL